MIHSLTKCLKAHIHNALLYYSGNHDSIDSVFESLCPDDIVVVTGGAAGLGRDICSELARRGVRRVVSLDIVVPYPGNIDPNSAFTPVNHGPVNVAAKLEETADNESVVDEHFTESQPDGSDSTALLSEDASEEVDTQSNTPISGTFSTSSTSGTLEPPKQPEIHKLLPIPGVEYLLCDVSKIEEVRVAIKHVSSTLFGFQESISPVTVLINNAAVMRGKSLFDLTDYDVQSSLNVNLLGSFNTIRTVLPGMMEKKRGFIINISSVLGHLSPAQLSMIAATMIIEL